MISLADIVVCPLYFVQNIVLQSIRVVKRVSVSQTKKARCIACSGPGGRIPCEAISLTQTTRTASLYPMDDADVTEHKRQFQRAGDKIGCAGVHERDLGDSPSSDRFQ